MSLLLVRSVVAAFDLYAFSVLDHVVDAHFGKRWGGDGEIVVGEKNEQVVVSDYMFCYRVKGPMTPNWKRRHPNSNEGEGQTIKATNPSNRTTERACPIRNDHMARDKATARLTETGRSLQASIRYLSQAHNTQTFSSCCV